MSVKTSPVFQYFEQQHAEAKALFLALGKQIKTKKAVELLSKLEFLELYSDLMAKIHFENEDLGVSLFSHFKRLKKALRKIHHLKLVERNIQSREGQHHQRMESFSTYILTEKRNVQKEAFDLAIGSTLKIWDDFLVKTHQSSKGIKPLMISTAINQLANEELGYLQEDIEVPLKTQTFPELFESLRKIIMLENLLIHLGFNPIFVSQIHGEIQALKESLKPWYANHLTLQALSHFLAEKENPSKKYMEWAKELKAEKKSLSSQIEKQAVRLMEKLAV